MLKRRTWNVARVQDGSREPRVVAVEFRLPRPVGIHLKQRLRIDLAAIVVVPARVQHLAVLGDRGIVRVDLVEAEAPQEAAVGVAGVEIAYLRPPAVDRLHAAARIEQDVAVGQVGALVVGETQSRCELADRLGGYVVVVEMVVVLAIGFLPRKQNLGPVVGHVGIANHAVRVVDQRADPAMRAVHLEHAERCAGRERPFPLGIGLALGIGVMRSAEIVVFGEHNRRPSIQQWTQPRRTALLARTRVPSQERTPLARDSPGAGQHVGRGAQTVNQLRFQFGGVVRTEPLQARLHRPEVLQHPIGLDRMRRDNLKPQVDYGPGRAVPPSCRLNLDARRPHGARPRGLLHQAGFGFFSQRRRGNQRGEYPPQQQVAMQDSYSLHSIRRVDYHSRFRRGQVHAG